MVRGPSVGAGEGEQGAGSREQVPPHSNLGWCGAPRSLLPAPCSLLTAPLQEPALRHIAQTGHALETLR